MASKPVKRGKYYYFTYWSGSGESRRKKWVNTKETDYQEALKAKTRSENAKLDRSMNRVTADGTFDDLKKLFYRELEGQRRTPRAINTYRNNNQIRAYLHLSPSFKKDSISKLPLAE